MRYVMVRYRLRPDAVSENEALVRAVYAELASSRPDGFRYATFKLPDGVSFTHVAVHEDEAANPLSSIAAFAEFTAGIRDRCEEPPVVSELEVVGAYGL